MLNDKVDTKQCTNKEEYDIITIEAIKHHKTLNVVVALQNVIIVVAFIILAIAFNKW